MPDERLQDLGQRLKQASRRSSFGQYLRTSFPEFEVTLKESGVRWATIAQWAVDTGLTSGRPLTPAAAKKTFERIKREQDKAASAGSAVRSGVVEIIREPAKPQPETPPPAEDDIDARLNKAVEGMGWAWDPKPKPRLSDPLERAREQLRKSDERLR